MNLPVPILSSDSFSWKGRHGVAEHSSLRDQRIFGRLYPNTINSTQGFAIRSAATGKVVIFELVKNNFDPNANPEECAEVVSWEFVSMMGVAGERIEGITVLILND